MLGNRSAILSSQLLRLKVGVARDRIVGDKTARDGVAGKVILKDYTLIM